MNKRAGGHTFENNKADRAARSLKNDYNELCTVNLFLGRDCAEKLLNQRIETDCVIKESNWLGNSYLIKENYLLLNWRKLMLKDLGKLKNKMTEQLF